MIPILYQADLDHEALQGSGAVELQGSGGSVLYGSGAWYTARTFTNFGIGALADCITCEVTEERNGGYELTFQYPLTGVHFDDIQNRCIVVAKPNYSDNPQPFRIYQITTPINGVITVNAQHIAYDLAGVPAGFFTASSASSACSTLASSAGVQHPFTITSDVTLSADFTIRTPSSVFSWFGGKEGSLIDVYGGEWHYDGYTCTLKENRGQDRGVVIRYGYNLMDLNQEANIANMYTAVMPFWQDINTGKVVNAGIINASGSFNFCRVLVLDLTQEFNEEPTKAQLATKARKYMRTNNVGVPSVNITLDFAQTTEQVELCDTVTVLFEKMGITATAKCIKTVWDVLKERYLSFDFGDAKPTIADTIVNLQKAVKRGK